MPNTEPRFVFFGTDEFATIILDQLEQAGLRPSLIVTRPDQPKGRKLILTPPPVKVWAQIHQVNFIQPVSLKKLEPDSPLAGLNWPLFVVASYGKIIPSEILALATKGTLNVHPSLLPKYRGPSPIQTAILNGDLETGVTIMLLDEQVDHGPILKQEKYINHNQDLNYLDLRKELGQLGGKLLAQTIPDWLADKIKPLEQDHRAATFTKMIEKSDGEIKFEDIENRPLETYRKFLAYTPWPGIYFFEDGKNTKNIQRVKITDCHLREQQLEIKKVVPEGRREMSWEDYQRGN